LFRSLGRVLAENQYVPADVPPADNSAVDGYAVCLADVAAGKPMAVSARIPAGVAPGALEPGTAARIFTGSEIPEGADAVVMQERTESREDGVVITAAVEAGQNIRRQGQDLRRGEVALAAGTPIRAQQMGLLGSMGIGSVEVRQRLPVAVFPTGDELAGPGQPLGPGQIYNPNRFTLAGLLQELDCDLVRCETLRDDRESTHTALLE